METASEQGNVKGRKRLYRRLRRLPSQCAQDHPKRMNPYAVRGRDQHKRKHKELVRYRGRERYLGKTKKKTPLSDGVNDRLGKLPPFRAPPAPQRPIRHARSAVAGRIGKRNARPRCAHPLPSHRHLHPLPPRSLLQPVPGGTKPLGQNGQGHRRHRHPPQPPPVQNRQRRPLPIRLSQPPLQQRRKPRRRKTRRRIPTTNRIRDRKLPNRRLSQLRSIIIRK